MNNLECGLVVIKGDPVIDELLTTLLVTEGYQTLFIDKQSLNNPQVLTDYQVGMVLMQSINIVRDKTMVEKIRQLSLTMPVVLIWTHTTDSVGESITSFAKVIHAPFDLEEFYHCIDITRKRCLV